MKKYIGNDKLVEIGKAYCKSQKACSMCPLLHKPCITASGDLLYFDEMTTLEEAYAMLNAYTDWIK